MRAFSGLVVITGVALNFAGTAQAQELEHAGQSASAVFHQEFDFSTGVVTGDLSVQCGAFRDDRPAGLGPEDEAVPFIVHITMGVPTGVGDFHVTYIGGFPPTEVAVVDYPFRSDETFNISFAAGSDLGTDPVVQLTLTADPIEFANITGQMSIYLHTSEAKPHPAVNPPHPRMFCTTTPAP